MPRYTSIQYYSRIQTPEKLGLPHLIVLGLYPLKRGHPSNQDTCWCQVFPLLYGTLLFFVCMFGVLQPSLIVGVLLLI